MRPKSDAKWSLMDLGWDVKTAVSAQLHPLVRHSDGGYTAMMGKSPHEVIIRVRHPTGMSMQGKEMWWR